jgi:hypothetical protein
VEALVRVERKLASAARAAAVPLSPLRKLRTLVGEMRESMPELRDVLEGAREAARALGAGDEQLPEDLRPGVFMDADVWEDIAAHMRRNGEQMGRVPFFSRFGRKHARAYAQTAEELANIADEIAVVCRQIASQGWDPSEHERGVSEQTRAELREDIRAAKSGEWIEPGPGRILP